MKAQLSIYKVFTGAFLAVTTIASVAVISGYSGNIQLKFGADGLQLQVKGLDK
jgi:hypothetical protein